MEIVYKPSIMKHTICIFVAFIAMATFDTVPMLSVTASNETYVYICTGPKSKRYHKTSSCRGLEKCSKDVKKVTLVYAEGKGRTPCNICYK